MSGPASDRARASTALILSEVETGQLDVERAAAWLARCRNVDDLRLVRDRARALEVYQRTRKASLSAQQDASEIAIRAERRLGELCREALAPGRPKKRSREPTVSLKGLGISKDQSSRWQKLAAIAPKDFAAHVQSVRTKGERLTTAGTIRATSDAEDYDGDEWYTPSKYIEAAREVMGSIDLDPASCAAAQERVEAAEYFTKDNDGLKRPWRGTVWLNPPFSKPLASPFVEKLLAEYAAGRVSQAILLQNASTDTAWFHRLVAGGFVCLVKGRIAFIGPDGQEVKNNRSAQVFFYLGDEGAARFADVFRRFGAVGRLLGASPSAEAQ